MTGGKEIRPRSKARKARFLTAIHNQTDGWSGIQANDLSELRAFLEFSVNGLDDALKTIQYMHCRAGLNASFFEQRAIIRSLSVKPARSLRRAMFLILAAFDSPSRSAWNDKRGVLFFCCPEKRGEPSFNTWACGDEGKKVLVHEC